MSGEDHVDQSDAEQPRYPERTAPTVEEGAVTVRSEEELVLDTQLVPRERVRLIKRVVTETVTTTTEVRREELHVERFLLDEGHATDLASEPSARDAPSGAEPAGQERRPGRVRDRLTSLQQRARNAGAAARSRSFTDETLDITLMEEQVVVTKRVVPRERVRLRKETIIEQRQITGDLRKEQVNIEHTSVTGPQSAPPREPGARS